MADINLTRGGRKIDESLHKTNRHSLAFTSGVTVKSFTIAITANVKKIVLEIPVFSGANPTTKLTIENSDSVEIYESPSTVMVENETHVITTNLPLVGTYTVKVTLSTDPSSDGTVYVAMYVGGN